MTAKSEKSSPDRRTGKSPAVKSRVFSKSEEDAARTFFKVVDLMFSTTNVDCLRLSPRETSVMCRDKDGGVSDHVRGPVGATHRGDREIEREILRDAEARRGGMGPYVVSVMERYVERAARGVMNS
jgi:hypothetical protein